MDPSRPYAGVASRNGPVLCLSCAHRVPHVLGGATCATDPLRITVTWSCGGFAPKQVGDFLTD